MQQLKELPQLSLRIHPVESHEVSSALYDLIWDDFLFVCLFCQTLRGSKSSINIIYSVIIKLSHTAFSKEQQKFTG